MIIKNLFPFLAPEIPVGSGGGAEEKDELSQDLGELGEEEPVEEEKEEEEGEEKEGEVEGEVDEEEDEEEKDEEEEDEEDEEEEPKEIERDSTGRPTVKAIKAKYPELFKDFPELKRAFFTSPRYEELFADPEQAQEAASKAAEYDTLENSLVEKGDPTLLVQTLNQNNPRALKKIIGNFAEAIRTHAPDDYLELTQPIIEELCYHAAKHGDKIGGQSGKNLRLAAQHIANFVFANGGDIPDIAKRNPQVKSEAEKALEEERATNAREKFENAVSSIFPAVSSALDAVLGSKLIGLTSFERKSVIKDARADVDKALRTDKAFQASLARLWDKSKLENYSPASKERIKDAYLSRAKQLAIPIRNRLYQEALGARSGEGNKDGKEEKQRKRTFRSSGGQARRGGSGRVLDPTKIDWRNTTDIDILNKD